MRVLGMHGSHSPMAVWSRSDGQQPVLWIDSEGQVFAVAPSLPEFLSLLPFGTGFIYDLCASSEPDDAGAEESLASQAGEYPDHAELLTWLRERGIEPAERPAEIVARARETCPALPAIQ